MKDYLIDEASGHFATTKSRAYHEQVRLFFDCIINYLQSNGLTARILLKPGETTDEKTKIMSSDLTEVGLELMGACYDKWLKSHDRGKPITDMTIFDKELAKLRK
ncbi:MAG: hypothetical protein U1F71_15685 [Verrucomicrobiaceae bacterium]